MDKTPNVPSQILERWFVYILFLGKQHDLDEDFSLHRTNRRKTIALFRLKP
jgi:hypothetical protein